MKVSGQCAVNGQCAACFKYLHHHRHICSVMQYIVHVQPKSQGSVACLQHASTVALKQLKAIRSTATALTTRVRKIKSELEDILQDDQDMCASGHMSRDTHPVCCLRALVPDHAPVECAKPPCQFLQHAVSTSCLVVLSCSRPSAA